MPAQPKVADLRAHAALKDRNLRSEMQKLDFQCSSSGLETGVIAVLVGEHVKDGGIGIAGEQLYGIVQKHPIA